MFSVPDGKRRICDVFPDVVDEFKILLGTVRVSAIS